MSNTNAYACFLLTTIVCFVNCLNAEDVYKLVQYSFVVSIWDWNLIEKMKILQVVGVLFLNKSSNVSFVRCRWQPLYQLIGSNSSRDSRRWSRHTRVAKEEHCIAICNAFKEKRREECWSCIFPDLLKRREEHCIAMLSNPARPAMETNEFGVKSSRISALPLYQFPAAARKAFWGMKRENGNWWEVEKSQVGLRIEQIDRLWGIGPFRSNRHFSLLLLPGKTPFYKGWCFLGGFFRRLWFQKKFFEVMLRQRKT